jgi:wax ester synthase-like acyl-CoA acyltransferase family protein
MALLSAVQAVRDVPSQPRPLHIPIVPAHGNVTDAAWVCSEPKVPAGGTIDSDGPETVRLTIRSRGTIQRSPGPMWQSGEIALLGKGGVMDRLNPLDALFVDAEDKDRHTSMAIASIAVFEGPSPSYDEILASLAGRLPLVPRYRQKLRTVPFRLGRPVWVDDPDFDLHSHVRRTALPYLGATGSSAS